MIHSAATVLASTRNRANECSEASRTSRQPTLRTTDTNTNVRTPRRLMGALNREEALEGGAADHDEDGDCDMGWERCHTERRRTRRRTRGRSVAAGSGRSRCWRSTLLAACRRAAGRPGSDAGTDTAAAECKDTAARSERHAAAATDGPTRRQRRPTPVCAYCPCLTYRGAACHGRCAGRLSRPRFALLLNHPQLTVLIAAATDAVQQTVQCAANAD